MPAARRRPVGAHAAPRRASARVPRRASPDLHRERTRPNVLSGLLLAVIAGPLAVLTLLPAADTAPASGPSPTAAAPAAAGAQAAGPERASRSRESTRPPLVAQAAAAPAAVPPPPPPPPPPVLPGCDGEKADLDRYTNGKLPASVLCRVPGSTESLRADAAVAFVRLAGAYEQHFGTPICLTDGYRTLAEQSAVRRLKPRLAARPGTSEHGWGLAVDLACGVQSFRSAQHAWMVQNAETYGWHLPAWARRGGAKPEPWHWEYLDA